MSRRRSRRRGLHGIDSDTAVGVGLLVAGVGLAYYLWKKNTPSPEEVAAALALREGKSVAGLAGCNCEG
jgi:hypothetical protein